MNFKASVIFAVIWFLPFISSAQTDTTFWFAAPDLQSAHGDRPVLLRISTGALAATVTISLPANNAFIPIVATIPANSSQSIDLTPHIDLIENSSVNTVSNKGIKISSTSIISCYYDIAHGLNGDIFALKGANGLGFKFTLPFQMAFGGYGLPNYTCSFSIVASDDNTIVTINPKFDLLAHPAGVPFTVVLNKGQTYTCQAATNDPASRPGGTIVTSNKRIAISTKDDSLIYPNQGCGDTAGDQLIPDCNAGDVFIIPRGQLNGPDYYYVFAINNNTAISVNGVSVATISAGNFYRGLLTDASCIIQTSSPVHVFHVSGFGCELGGAVIPAIDNPGSSVVTLTRAATSQFYINVITSPANTGSFLINGLSTVLNPADFTPVPSSNGNWVVARIPISLSIANAGQNIKVQNTLGRFHIGVIHGDGSGTTRYGYFSDFERVNINLTQYDTLYCKGSNISITASSPGASDFQWTGPNGFTSSGPLLQVNNFQLANQGYYTVSANSARCGYVERKVWIGLQLPNANFSATTQCLNGGPTQFSSTSTINAGSISSLNWNFGGGNVAIGQQVTYQYAAAGTYSVTLLVVTDKLCRDSIQRLVSVHAAPTTVIASDGPPIFCVNQVRTLISTNQPGSGTLTNYQWLLNGSPIAGAISSTLVVTQSGDYKLEVRNSNGCQNQSNTLGLIASALPTGTLVNPSVTAICEGGTVSLTASGGDTYQWFLNSSPLSSFSGAILMASQPGTYTVELISPQGCRKMASGSVTLTLIRKSVPDFSHTTKCAMVPTPFANLSTLNSTGNVNWEWNFGDGNSSSLFEPSHTYRQSGNYQVTLKINPSECPNLISSITKTVVVESRMANMRYPPANAVRNQSLNLQARTFGINYTWSPPVALSSISSPTPIFRHDQTVEYLITIQTNGNCITVDTLQVRIFSSNDILVPSAFTPNNDGLNDKLEFFLIGLKQLNFLRIFNRWGQLVFETNTDKKFWDGTQNGSNQPSGVYVWYAEGIAADNSKIFRKGLVTLIRK